LLENKYYHLLNSKGTGNIMFEFEDTPTNFILITVGAIFAMLALVVVYYVLIGYNSTSMPKTRAQQSRSPGSTNDTTSVSGKPGISNSSNKTYDGLPASGLPQATPPAGLTASPEAGTKQVFHIADNLFTYDDAEAVCRAYGADLATYDQMVDAYKKGANWCSYGWTKEQMALYPIQYSYWQKLQDSSPEEAGACGVPGINGGYFENPNMQFGVNCYGAKRGPRKDEKVKDIYVSDKERAIRAKIAAFQKQLGKFKLLPFNEDKWGSCNL
jgi:hypothetical protein